MFVSTVRRAPASRQDGFTLIELLIVLVIIAILAAVAIPQYRNVTSEARISAAEYEMTLAMRGIYMYQTTNDTMAFPITSMISNYEDLRLVVAPFIGMPPREEESRFTFVSYSADDTSFTLIAKARDSGRTQLTLTNDRITRF